MTTTYDPTHPAYADEADLREEMTRVYDLCHGCRLCFNLCPAFPSLFDFIDRRDGAVEALSVAEQDQVVDECYQCKLCFVKCPYVPPHEWALDFPRLMLRANAARRQPLKDKVAEQFLGRTDLLGRIGVATAPLTNKAMGARNSLARKAMERTVGIAADRLLPPYARTRFTTWFKRRPRPPLPAKQRDVAVFPTCLVEYQNPAVGQDLVKVYERNGVECTVPEVGCCGAPWLHSGNFDAFKAQARKNVPALARAVREGKDIVVAQPTCGYVLKKDYRDYLGGPDCEAIAAHTYDAAEYLVDLHRGEATSFDTEFTGAVPEEVTYHVACHLQAQNVGLRSRDLMKLTGAKVTLVNKCSGIDGTWGYRAKNYELARQVAQPMKEAIERAGNSVVTGDCHLANGAIRQETGIEPIHPIQMVARAYGLPEERQ